MSSRSCADVEVSSAGVLATVVPEGVLCSGGSEHQWRVGVVFGTRPQPLLPVASVCARQF